MLDKQTSRRETTRKVLRYVRRYRAQLLISLLCALLSVSLTLLVPVLVGRVVDLAVGPGRVDFSGVLGVLIWIGAAVLMTAAAQWLMNVLNNKITYQTVRDIRAEAFSKLSRLPLSYLDAHPTGALVSRVISDIDQFSEGLLMGFGQLFTGVVTIAGTLIFMLLTNVQITMVVILVTPVSLLAARFVAQRTYDMFRLQSEARADQTALIDEMVSGQKVVRAFGHESAALDAFDEVSERLRRHSLRAIFFSSLTNPATRFVNGLVYAAVGILGALLALGGGISVGVLTCFLSYANQYTKPFNEISGVLTELQNALNCAARVFALLEAEEQPAEDADAVDLRRPRGEVRLLDVSFAYTKEKPLLSGIDLSALPGQRIAIVGPTGCGKTTLINLLMRFYDVDDGAITLDGFDIRHLTRHSLRRGYGMVLQDTWLRRGTVRDNIALGRPDATLDEVIAAATAARAHAFILRLPNGYDTELTEDGALSVGQKQLLCIARIMLCLPPMLILDEATSSIDTRTELLIQDAFAKLMRGRLSFIVAHRLSTIQNADLILCMKDGNIVEQGRHEALLERGGFYAELYNSQFAQAAQ